MPLEESKDLSNEQGHKNPWATWWVIIVLISLRLLFTANAPISIRAHLQVDDEFYTSSANFIAEGQWLGPYDHTTLAKMPGYPIILAGFKLVGISTRLGQDLLLVAASLALFGVMSLVRFGLLFRLCALGAILFSPATLSAGSMAYVLRESVYPSLTIIVLCAGLGTVVPGGMKRRLICSMGLGLSLALYWQIREEGIWIVPALVLMAVAGILLNPGAKGSRIRSTATILLLSVLPIGLLFGGRIGVMELNRKYYGVAIETELKSPEFVAAIGAIQRVKPKSRLPYEPVDRETMEGIAKVSPAFAEILPILRGPTNRNSHPPTENNERTLDVLKWVVRRAASRKGHHRNAEVARDYYLRLATQINDACDSGKIPADERRDSLAPRFKQDFWWPTVVRTFTNMGRAIHVDVSPMTLGGIIPRDYGLTEDIAIARRVIREPNSHLDLDFFRRRNVALWMLNSAKKYQFSCAILALLASVIVVICGFRKRFRPATIVPMVLGFAFVLRAATVAMVDVYYIPSFGPNYLLPAYLLLPAWVVTSWADAWAALSLGRRNILPPSVTSPFLVLLGTIIIIASVSIWNQEGESSERVLSTAELQQFEHDGMTGMLSYSHGSTEQSSQKGLTLTATAPGLRVAFFSRFPNQNKNTVFHIEGTITKEVPGTSIRVTFLGSVPSPLHQKIKIDDHGHFKAEITTGRKTPTYASIAFPTIPGTMVQLRQFSQTSTGK